MLAYSRVRTGTVCLAARLAHAHGIWHARDRAAVPCMRVCMRAQVESTFYEQLEERCQQERMLKQRAWAWGNREAALNMKMESCDKLTKLNTRLNARSGYHGGR